MSAPNFTSARAYRDYMNRDKEVVAEQAKMSLFNATMIAEGADEPESQEQYLEAWQLLVDTGTCWQLQGFFGRTAQALIDEGLITPPA